MENKPYIYALLYKGYISYIGLHNGKDKYYFSGGVIPRKLGKDKFIKGIIEYCNENELIEKEMYYISLYKPKFNLTTGGERTCINTKHSLETINKRKQSLKNNLKHMSILKNRFIDMNLNNNPAIKYKIQCLNDNLIFDSIRKASTHYNIDNSYLSKHMKGKYKSIKGLKFIRL